MKSLKYLFLFLFVFSLMFSTCKKDQESSFTIDCDQILTGMLEVNGEIVTAEINTLTMDLFPEPITGDDLGHSANLENLVERLEEACENFEVSILCYACIETLPLQSEIKIVAQSSGIEIERIIDVLTPEDGILQAISMHE